MSSENKIIGPISPSQSNPVNNAAVNQRRKRQIKKSKVGGQVIFLPIAKSPRTGAGKTLHVSASKGVNKTPKSKKTASQSAIARESAAESAHTEHSVASSAPLHGNAVDAIDFSKIDAKELLGFLSNLKKEYAKQDLDVSPFIEQLEGKDAKEAYTHADGRVKELDSQIQQMQKESELKAKFNELHAEKNNIKLKEVEQDIGHKRAMLEMNCLKAFMEMLVSASQTMVDLARKS